MCCIEVNESRTYCPNFELKETLVGALNIALSTISLCGIGLSVCSIISFLPPIAGYCGGALCISSLIALAVLNIASKGSVLKDPSHTSTAHDAVQQMVPVILPKNQSGDTIRGTSAKSAEILPILPLIIPDLPDEIYTYVFTYLGASSVSKVSQVCLRWSRLASIEELWTKFCMQEVFCPPEDGLAFSHSYKNAYQNSKIFKHRVLQWESSECKMPIALPQEPSLHYAAHAFLGTKDRFFVLHSGDEDQFEIWDVSLKARLFWQIVPSMNRGWMKLIEETIFLIGWEEIRYTHSLRNIIVYPFNIRTNQALPSMEFSQEHRAHFNSKTPFDLNDSEAFTGQEDGVIRVWDLKSEGKVSTKDYIRYEEVENTGRSTEMKLLKGHTKEITALRLAGNFLFSGAHDGTIKQWDLAILQCIQTIETGLDKGVSFLKVAGPYVFGLTQQLNTICQWNIATKELLFRIDLEGMCNSFHIIYNLLFCYFENKSKLQVIQVYDLSTKKCIKIHNCQTISGRISDNLMQILNDCLYIKGNNELIAWDFSTPCEKP